MTDMDITIRRAQPTEARPIAQFIMIAMNYECCQYFAGPEHTLADFEDMMTALVARSDSQYSYLNTLVATHGSQVVGVCVSYDGAQLQALRRAFIDEALHRFGRDFSSMDDETKAGELYIDSLCVAEGYRGQGIASQLIQAAIARGRQMGTPAVGLLVDTGNPKAETLYKRIGFTLEGESSWGGHAMRHLQYHL